MSGSEAEERIRAKAEAMLRRRWPEARIIHELVLQQGGCRIDLAAVTLDSIILIEVKSERDVLDRLADQTAAALRVGDLFGVCIAEKHAAKVGPWYRDDVAVKLPYDANLLVETDDGFIDQYTPFSDGYRGHRRDEPRLCNPADRLEMLWADELKLISASKHPRQRAKRLICETMNGREIRRAVCDALRARAFPRADAPIPHPPVGLLQGAA